MNGCLKLGVYFNRNYDFFVFKLSQSLYGYGNTVICVDVCTILVKGLIHSINKGMKIYVDKLQEYFYLNFYVCKGTKICSKRVTDCWKQL